VCVFYGVLLRLSFKAKLPSGGKLLRALTKAARRMPVSSYHDPTPLFFPACFAVLSASIPMHEHAHERYEELRTQFGFTLSLVTDIAPLFLLFFV